MCNRTSTLLHYSKKSVILLWVLIIVFIFSLIFLGLFPKLYLWSTITNKSHENIFINWNFYSAQEFAKKILMESAYPKFNSQKQVWGLDNLEYRFSESNYFKLTIKDEDGKFPLNKIFSSDFLNPISEDYKKILTNLLRIAKFSGELNDVIKLWEDRIKIYQVKAPLLSFEDFISFPQFQYNKYIFNTDFVHLSEYVTVYSSGKININTIRKEVFLSLSDKITEKTYDSLQYIIKNSSYGIKEVNELSKYSEFESFYEDIKDYLTTESIYFVVEIMVFYEESVATKRLLFKKYIINNKVRFEKIAELPQYRLTLNPTEKLRF